MKFLGPKPWPRITKLAEAHRGTVAVPFIGKGGATMLPLLPGSLLVTRIDTTSVKQGTVDPREVLRLFRRGVEVHCSSALHAKVYVFGRRAVVGSANLSSSSHALREACVETTDSAAVAAARQFVRALRTVPVGPEQLKSLIPLFPSNGVLRGHGAGVVQAQPKVFILPIEEVEWSHAAETADVKGTAAAGAGIADSASHYLDRISVPKQDSAAMRPGDIVICRWASGRRFALEPPGHVVHVEPYRGGSIVYLEIRKRQRHRVTLQVRGALGESAKFVLYPEDQVRQVRRSEVASALLGLWLSKADKTKSNG